MEGATLEPSTAKLPAKGGISSHTLSNTSTSKAVFKIKCSNNNEYRLNPVFGVVEPNSTAQIEVHRLPGEPKKDRLVVQMIESDLTDTTEIAALFKKQQPQKQLDMKLIAEADEQPKADADAAAAEAADTPAE